MTILCHERPCFWPTSIRLRVFRKIDFPIKAPSFRAAIALERSPGKYTTSELSFRKRGCYLPFESSDENSPFCKNIKRKKRKGESERKKEERKDEPSLNGQWHLRGWRNNPPVSPHLHEIPDTAPALLFLFSSLDLVFALAVQRFARIHFPGTLINSLAE